MKAHLMYRDRDFDLKQSGLPFEAALTQDLELRTLFAAMAADNPFLLEVARQAVLASLHEPETILYRQHILADCLERSAIVREMYALAVEAIEQEKQIWGWRLRDPEGLLHRSVKVLQLFVTMLKRLRGQAEEHGAKFRSEGFTAFYGMLVRELDDDFLSIVESHLGRLAYPEGVLMSAELGKGNKGTRYLLRAVYPEPSWMERLSTWIREWFYLDRSELTYRIADRDETGFRVLGELRGRGISLIASALGQSSDHILEFFRMLRLELGFYIGCLNLHDRLTAKNEPICFPVPLSSQQPALHAQGLYDPCLSLSLAQPVVGNDVNAADRQLVIITGANRGGKSTLLRAVGLAQLMMQSGMFVPAISFRANVCAAVFTHFKREEDAGMKSGKLDEELSRMSAIVDHLRPNSMVLFNESFAATNEREGSEIARQIVRALTEAGIKVLYVTHMFDLAHGFCRSRRDATLFLRAERLPDGQRTFRLIEGEPLPTSYGEDLYRRIFGEAGQTVAASSNCGGDNHER